MKNTPFEGAHKASKVIQWVVLATTFGTLLAALLPDIKAAAFTGGVVLFVAVLCITRGISRAAHRIFNSSDNR
jgi:hypothetical protein